MFLNMQVMILSIDSLVFQSYLCMNDLQKGRLMGLLVEIRGPQSQRAFSRHLKVSYAALRSWESGESLPTLDNLENIAAFKRWSLIQLFDYLGLEITLDQLLEMVLSRDKSERLTIAKKLLQSVDN